jgi:hypothetical protein
MAACHPKLKTNPGAELFLSRFADNAWREVVRPWLEEGHGTLGRSLVVAPTRGHTQALKQRCLAEGVRLLGVEFLTPSLARKKRRPAAGLGRSLQLLLLRARIAARADALAPGDPARLLWRSLESDLESALSDFEDLMRGGFSAENFPHAELQAVFRDLAGWVACHGYGLAALQDLEDGLKAPGAGGGQIADRALILAGGAECWPDFFGLVALARRCRSVSVVLASPEFGGKNEADQVSDQEWVEVWEAALAVAKRSVDDAEPQETCAAVAELWAEGRGSADRAGVVLGLSRSGEMEQVALAVGRLLAGGSENIAVILPGAGPAHARLVGLLDAAGTAYADLIGIPGTPPIDVAIQRALVDFHGRGCRLEELLALWPLLRSLSLANLTPARARVVCQDLFDDAQTHAVGPLLGRLEGSDDPDWKEVGRVARLLLPEWPDPLTPPQALALFEAARDRLTLAEPPGWNALRDFAGRAAEPMPAAALLEAIRSFLPEQGPLIASPGKTTFARVTLTTVRRAAGVSWSDVILTGANARIWPERRESSTWLGDEARRELDRKLGRFSLGLPTREDRAELEKRLYCTLARDCRRRVVFSASLFSEEDPEARLAPNTWLERVMWEKGYLSAPGSGSEGYGRLAASARRAERPEALAAQGAWPEIWRRRRDPSAKFDAYFLGDPGGASRPASLTASQIGRGVRDPATLWFDAVLRVRRVGWHPFSRDRRKAVGTAVHRVLAAALKGAPAEGVFFHFPDRASASGRLAGELARLRSASPRDRYWDSFHMDVERAARELLARVYDLPPAAYGAAEAWLPEGAAVPVGAAGTMPVRGKMDLVLSERPAWAGSRVEIADFKTGGDSRLSARTMASKGASLQLGVYLEAARSLGATGSVWMLKPEERPASIGVGELDAACVKLRVLGDHLATGIYGARTPDRTDYSHGFEWPLACAPIAAPILEAKFEATFGAAQEAAGGDDGDE